MAKKAHIWNKNDKITADRLNSMSKPINALLDGGTGGTTQDKPHGDSDTANWANAIDDAQPVIHDKATWVGYRHPTYGTADLYENDGPIGIYATAPTVRDARGDIQQDIVHFGCMPCYLSGNGCAGNGETVYLHVKTTCKGGLTYAVGTSAADGPKARYIVGSASCNQWFGLNEGGGDFYFPVAKIGQDPKFTCQKIAMQYNPIVIPLKADDASYLPPYVMGSGARGIQGMRMAQAVEQNIVPILGLNNHGGVKVLPDFDTDGIRRSNAIMASPELYGRATECEYNEDQEAGGCSIYAVDVPGTDEDGNETCNTMYLYQPYNAMYPFASGDGGLLAKWPIYQLQACGKEKVKVGELKLNGGHIGDQDWQLWFQGEGEIVLPCGGLKLPAFGTAGTRQQH